MKQEWDKWRWYYSHDEERYIGPFISRDEAIKEGQDCLDEGDNFFIGEFKNGPLMSAIFDNLDERFDDANDDLGDPEEYPSSQISQDQWRELERELNATMAAWVQRHGFTAWTFSASRNLETVTVKMDIGND